jgi:cyclic pyranopterin phosphate synthase
MVKAVDKSCVITDVRIEEKSGGKSGLYRRSRREERAERGTSSRDPEPTEPVERSEHRREG